MDTDQSTPFKLYSLGVAAEDLPLGSIYLKVFPSDVRTMHDGEVNTTPNNVSVAASTTDGQSYSVGTQAQAFIIAEWLPLGQHNRQTPPNLLKGAQVHIYYLEGSQDQYYWIEARNDLRFRKLEDVAYAYKASPKIDEVATDDNCYVVRYSPLNKLIHIHTSKANGEEFKYDIVIDTANSILRLTDDQGNRFTINSPAKQLRLENSSGNYIDLIDSVLTMDVKKQINIRTTEYNQTVETANYKATTTNMQSNTTNLTGNQFNAQANTAFQGALTSNGKNISDSHAHLGVKRGFETTDGVV